MKIAIDFDGVIHDDKHPVKKMGPPMAGALEILQDIHDQHQIIIYTTRANTPSGRKSVADWLEYYDVGYDEIVGKPGADWYIDDKGINFSSWESIRKRLHL